MVRVLLCLANCYLQVIRKESAVREPRKRIVESRLV